MNSPETGENFTHLTLLGGIGIQSKDGEDIPLPTRKARLLLAYLASPVDRLHQRNKLIGLLWSDRQEGQARGSLRNALSALRKILGADALKVEGDGIALQSNYLDVDANRFQFCVAESNLNSLREAAALYRGDFLDGVASDDAPYQEWVLFEQLRIRALAKTTFSGIAELELNTQSFGPALDAASRLLELEPLDEQSHRMAMRIYAASGQRSQALRQYENCKNMLANELNVGPSEETEQLSLDVRNLDPKEFCILDRGNATPVLAGSDDTPAVAVLPFHNPSDDPEQDYFADGLTEDIITQLMAWRSFRVIARNSSFRYQGKNVPISQIAHELGACYLLEGSIRKGSGRLRITARLNDAVTGNQVWAEIFDRDETDMFELQDELAQRIAAVIEPEIDQIERRRAASKKPPSLAAWEWYQRGMYLLYKFSKSEIEEARPMFCQALVLDPDYARAQIGLAYSHQLDILLEYTEEREASIVELLKHAQLGVALDDGDSMAHVMNAFAYRWSGQHEMAVAEGYRAVELNPNDAWAHVTLGNVLDLSGNSREGITYIEKGLLLNPHDAHNFFVLAILARANIIIREYVRAVNLAREAIRRNSEQPRAHLYLAVSLGHQGQIEEARAALNTCEHIQPGFAQKWAQWREYQNDADNDHFSEGLELAGLQEM